MPKVSTARKIVDGIISDIEDRSGLQNAWDEIDDGVRDEIKAAWIRVIEDVIGEDSDEDTVSPGLTDPDDGDDDNDSVDDDDEEEV